MDSLKNKIERTEKKKSINKYKTIKIIQYKQQKENKLKKI